MDRTGVVEERELNNCRTQFVGLASGARSERTANSRQEFIVVDGALEDTREKRALRCADEGGRVFVKRDEREVRRKLAKGEHGVGRTEAVHIKTEGEEIEIAALGGAQHVHCVATNECLMSSVRER